MPLGYESSHTMNIDVAPGGDLPRLQPTQKLAQIAPIGTDGVAGMALQTAQEIVERGTACGRRRFVQARWLRFTQGVMTRVATSRR